MQQTSLSHSPSVDRDFYQFINAEVLGKSSKAQACFWTNFATSVEKARWMGNGDRQSEICDPSKGENERWGSLHEGLYQSDIIPQCEGLKKGSRHNVARRNRAVALGKDFLDAVFPLYAGSHREVQSYMVYYENLMAILADGSSVGLKAPSQFIAKCGPKDNPEGIALRNNGLHIEILLDKNGPSGQRDLAGVDDILVEGVDIDLMDRELQASRTTFEQDCSSFLSQ